MNITFRFFLYTFLLITSPVLYAEFQLSDSDQKISVTENGNPVLTYNYGQMNPPEGLDEEKYWRSSYVYPIYNVAGENITEDFPSDHYHHRGIFWSWPESKVGDRKMDTWTLGGVRQVFEKWLYQEADADTAKLVVQNVWKFDDDPQPKVREIVSITIHKAKKGSRAIDFVLNFQNISEEMVSFKGAIDKGYGGFKFRLHAKNKPFDFFTDDGAHPKDTFVTSTPWVDTTWTSAASGKREGVAIFQHASNPDYPHDGWMLRHYGIVGPAWPLEEEFQLPRGESFSLEYRVLMHSGDFSARKISKEFSRYIKDED
jgi:hypothetical protein